MHPYRLEFCLSELPSRTNNRKQHWALRKKEADAWKTRVIWISRKVGIPPKPLKYARLTLIRFSSMAPDYDGLVSSFKHIIDGLILAKVIIDDRMENIGCPTYQWERAKPGHGYIKVIVEEKVLSKEFH